MEPHPGLDRTDKALFTRITSYHWITELWLKEAVLRLLVSQVCAECGDTECSGADLSWPNMLDWVGGYWRRCCCKLMPSVHESHQRLLDVLMCICATWCCTGMQSSTAGPPWPEMRNNFYLNSFWGSIFPEDVAAPQYRVIIQGGLLGKDE